MDYNYFEWQGLNPMATVEKCQKASPTRDVDYITVDSTGEKPYTDTRQAR